MRQSLQIEMFITKHVDTFNDGDIVVFNFLVLISKIVFLSFSTEELLYDNFVI